MVAARRGRDLPRQKTRRDGHDGVQVARLKLLRVARERQHARVLGAHVVGKREALHHVGLRLGKRPLARVRVRVVVRKPLRVAAGDVTGAGHVTHDEHVLGLGDHGLEVARVVTCVQPEIRFPEREIGVRV